MRRFWIVALVIIGVLCIGASGWYFIDRARQEQTVTQINDELRQLKENAGSEGETVFGVTAVRAAEGVHEMPAIAEELLEEDIPEETGTAPGPVPDEPVLPPEAGTDEAPEEVPEGEPEPLTRAEIEARILPEYKTIYLRNGDFIGWLTIPGLEVDHPVVQTVWDNSYYLYRDFNGDDNKNGTLILEAGCDPFLPSRNMIIYGHKMSSGAMFGTLDKYEKLSWWREHPLVQFDTLIARRQYVVIGCLRAVQLANNGPGSFHYVTDFADDAELEDWLNRIRRARYYDPGVDFGTDDMYLTLSTCSYHEDNGRLLVIARALREDEKPEDFLPRE